MKVTFPHLGPLYIVAARLLSYLGIPFELPPSNGKQALSKGAAISPEEMCMPFKYMAGNLSYAHEMGADTAVMIATGGPCRLGEYGELLKEVLDKAGYEYNWVLVDNFSSIGFRGVVKRLGSLVQTGDADRPKIIKGVFLSLRLIGRLDGFRSKIQKKAGYLNEPYEAVRLMKETNERLECAESFGECFGILRQAERKLASFAEKKDADPVKVLVAGEIYTSIEPEANGRLEEMLMAKGCSVKRHIDISWWIRYTLVTAAVPDKIRNIFEGRKTMNSTVGGYGRETAARIVKDRWCDGIIKIMPSGCMPEIVTKAFCQSVQEKRDIRVLHLIYDEMSGQAGYETRVEAFIDMLERRKYVLAGDRHRIHKYGHGVD